MNGEKKYLLDTNVIIRFLKGETELFSLFDKEENLFVSSVSIGELMYGAELSSKVEFNREMYLGLCQALNIIVPDEYVSAAYGKVKASLKRAGHPIPENDIWIAATAIEGNLTLVTADSDFEGIEGLSVEIQ
ncbi:MAG: PIN domain-containing protein [Treponema sp.]|nr:PIN domain-containing protein [Treponema sp.]